MTKKLYIVQIDNRNIRTISSEETIRIGSIIADEIWLGEVIKGGRVTKIFK